VVDEEKVMRRCGAWCGVVGSWFRVAGSWFGVVGSWLRVVGSWFRIPMWIFGLVAFVLFEVLVFVLGNFLGKVGV